MGMTITEKILAKASGKSAVAPGDLVNAKIDVIMCHDVTTPPAISMLKEKGIDRVILRLLVRTVGVIPAGSIIEFETGEWAVVIGPSSNPASLDLPTVRLVTDRRGRALEAPRELDLGAPSDGRQYPRIAAILDPAKAKINVAKAFLSAA